MTGHYPAAYAALFIVSFYLSVVAGFLTHIVACIIDGRWGLLILGTIIPPLGVLDGWAIWCGW
ncbi:hypothetical protein [Bradyrhizobium sp. SZCCHNR3118]|uniref:hypothetical protein n=1 Tax=Bradyrhizobium sp. SZCCHNR3118 TaxID=3057468 RepID=UPI002916B282|nr:hypothetical protein [Bradyrhizobium sp. SZCCHNR3118]